MLDVAIGEARKGLAEGGIPIGAALFTADGALLGSGHNRRVQDDDPSVHAETDAFRAAGRQRDYRSTVMVTTLSPCWYCSGLVRQFNIGAVVIGESRTFTGGHDWLAEHGVSVTVLDDERCVTMMADFIAANPELWNEGHWSMKMIATVDISHWREGGATADAVAAEVDEGLQRAGFILVTGHGVDPALARDVRAAARAFFAQPDEVKQRYSVSVGGHGWLGPGAEANAYAEGTETPPDLKESYSLGAETATGDPEVDRIWFAPNVWPAEVPSLQPLVTEYTAADAPAFRRSARPVRATRCGLPDNPFASLANEPTWTMNINHYPPVSVVGEPEPGQFRIGPHTDFGTVTILDREPGAGGLQVYSDADGWTDAPYDPAALTVNIGDLLEYWSGRRWPSGRHRVLPPQPHAPEEDLVSLIYFYEANHDAVVTPLEPPIGRVSGLEPVTSSAFIKERLDAITVG